MKEFNYDYKIGTKLYWHDQPTILAGIVVGFNENLDVLIYFVSGKELGLKIYSYKILIGFICKD